MSSEIENTYYQTLLSELEWHYKKHEAYTKRIALIKANNGYSTKNEFEKNEIEITILETQEKISALKKLITLREEYFKEWVKGFAKDLEECEKNFESVIASAKQHAKKNKMLSKELDSVVWENVEKMPEVKVKLYKRFKQLIS